MGALLKITVSVKELGLTGIWVKPFRMRSTAAWMEVQVYQTEISEALAAYEILTSILTSTRTSTPTPTSILASIRTSILDSILSAILSSILACLLR